MPKSRSASTFSIKPGEIRINGVNVFINDKNVASMKPIPPQIVQRADAGEIGSKPTVPPATKSNSKNKGHAKRRRSGNASVFHGIIRAPVTYVHQDAPMHCGRASLAMLRLKENPRADIHDGPNGELRELTPKAVSDLLPDYTTVNPHGIEAKEEALRLAGASINEGHPAMVKTDLYAQGEHIFVLTGYDPQTGQFTATNTFRNSENGGDPSGMTMMAGVPLDVAHLAQHLKSQGAGPLIFVPPAKNSGGN